MVSERSAGRLGELERALAPCGLVGRIVPTATGSAFLRVINPRAASLAEDVTCAAAPGTREFYFWWSWGERLHSADDPAAAAAKLAHVLQTFCPAAAAAPAGP